MACVISFKMPPPTVSYLLNQPSYVLNLHPVRTAERSKTDCQRQPEGCERRRASKVGGRRFELKRKKPPKGRGGLHVRSGRGYSEWIGGSCLNVSERRFYSGPVWLGGVLERSCSYVACDGVCRIRTECELVGVFGKTSETGRCYSGLVLSTERPRDAWGMHRAALSAKSPYRHGEIFYSREMPSLSISS